MRKNIINRLLEIEGLTVDVIGYWKESATKAKKNLNKPTKKGEILTPKQLYDHSVSMHKEMKVRRAYRIKELSKLSNKALVEKFEDIVREEEAESYEHMQY